jgi:hypothetical protein
VQFKRDAGNHAFNEIGGTCVKCGTTWAAFTDTDSKVYQRACPGQKPEMRERLPIDE